jgi:hypothetical protein
MLVTGLNVIEGMKEHRKFRGSAFLTEAPTSMPLP